MKKFLILIIFLPFSLIAQEQGWSTVLMNNSGIGADTTTCIFQDNQNNLWFGTIRGVSKFDGQNWIVYNESNSPLLNWQFIFGIEQVNNKMYFGGGQGVFEFDGSNWVTISTTSATTLLKDNSNNLWIGTRENGVYVYDGVNITIYNTSNTPLRSNKITDFAKEDNGTIWVSTIESWWGIGWGFNAGVVKFDGINWEAYYPGNSGLLNGNIHSIVIDENDNKWFGADSLYLFDFDGQNWNSRMLPNNGIVKYISSMDIDTLGNIWLGSAQYSGPGEGVYEFDGVEFILYDVGQMVNGNTYFNWINAGLADNNNVKWFGTWEGVVKYDNTPLLELISPNGGENIQSLNNFAITWNHQFVEQINIEFTSDGGNSWSTIASNIDPGNNIYNWNVPIVAPPSSLCKIKITSTNPAGISDESNEFFTVFAKVSDLTFNPVPGTYSTPQVVTISTITDSTIIYYTTDGTDPTQSSNLYTQPVNIDSSMVLKARAFRDDWIPSDIKSGNYIISDQVINIVINTEPIWYDNDYNSFEIRTVDGSGTTISYGNITMFEWLIDGNLVATGSVVDIQLNSGTKFLTLRAISDLGVVEQDSVEISVYVASVETNGPITSAVGQLAENIFFATSTDDQVYRFDSTGFVNWTILTGGDIQSTTCISNQNNIYVGSSDTRLYAFDSEGTPKWDRAMGGVIVSSPSISNDSMIYVGVSTGRLFAVSESGLIQWNYQTGGAIYSSPSVSVNGDVIVGSDDGKLYSISKDGDLNWTFTTIAPIQSSPAIGNDSTIVFGSDDGSVYKLNNSGGLVWSFDAGGAVKSSPVIDNTGQIYFGSENGKIYSLTSGGNLVWEYNAGGSILGSPALAPDGSIIIGNNNGKLLIISSSGEKLWYLQTQAGVQSPVLYTHNNLVVFGQNSGNIYIIKYPSSARMIPGLLNIAEWPTFKGSNKRTGNKLEIISDVEKNNNPLPSEFLLLQNYPNPFNSATAIQYSIPQRSNVTIKVYDILGNEVTTLVNEEEDQGVYTINFDANNLASGLYLYRIQAGSFIDTKKMILLK